MSACIWGSQFVGPITRFGEVQLWPAVAYGFTLFVCFSFTVECLRLSASALEWMSAHTGTGKSGTARWAKYRELKKDLSKVDAGPFWGISAKEKKKLFIDFVSNAYIIGPSGSGKGHTAVINLIFLIRQSKVIIDFKPELAAVCKQGLEKLGQRVACINPFEKYTSIVGSTASINVLDVINDSLNQTGTLTNVLGDARELTLQLYAELTSAGGDDQFWRNGSRKLIALCCVTNCMLHGHKATLSSVALLLEGRAALERQLRSVAGINFANKPDPDGPHAFELSDWADNHTEAELDLFLKTIRARTRSLLKLMDESEKMFNSFLEGAQQALEPYGFGQLSSAMQESSVDVDDLKNDGAPLNLFLVGDASRGDATDKFFGLMQWYIQLKLKRHPRKNAPVYFINDEANNYTIYGLTSLMTWARAFSIRTIQIFQSFDAYALRHGPEAVEVLNSESEIKLFLPGQRSSKTVEQIVDIVGEQSLMVASHSPDKDGSGVQQSMSESARPLMTKDEIRRTKNGILIVRQHRPILQTPISYSQIKPLRILASINPHHGKPYLKRVKLRLRLPKTKR